MIECIKMELNPFDRPVTSPVNPHFTIDEDEEEEGYYYDDDINEPLTDPLQHRRT